MPAKCWHLEGRAQNGEGARGSPPSPRGTRSCAWARGAGRGRQDAARGARLSVRLLGGEIVNGISPTSGSLKPPGCPGPGALRGPGRAVPSPRSPGCYRPEPNVNNSDCSWGTRGGRGGGGGDSGRREGETGTFGVEGELATLGEERRRQRARRSEGVLRRRRARGRGRGTQACATPLFAELVVPRKSERRRVPGPGRV